MRSLRDVSIVVRLTGWMVAVCLGALLVQAAVVALSPLRSTPRDALWSIVGAVFSATVVPLAAMSIAIRLVQRPMAQLARDVADRCRRLRPLDLQASVGTGLEAVVVAFNDVVRAVDLTSEKRRNLLAGVSHDLRISLARVRLRAEVECKPATALAIEADCDALDRMVAQFITYAEGEASATLGRRTPLRDLVHRIASAHAGRGVEVDMVDDAVASVFYPDIPLLRILANLVDNALTHGAAPVSIRVAVGATECSIVVSDAGKGLSPSDADNAIRPFERMRSASTTGGGAPGHHGLGLAVVAQICAEMGGHVFHRPYDGADSAVGVVLPRDGAPPSGR